jgi:hypothetical protein
MTASISLVKLKQSNKKEFLEIPFTEYFLDINETSYKYWSLKNTVQNWRNGSWQSHDLIFRLFSTGKSSLSGKMFLNRKKVLFNWRVELLDENKNQILTIKFAPIIFNNPKIGKARKIKFEKHDRNIDLALISKISVVRIYSE